jgi:hypothetical protein
VLNSFSLLSLGWFGFLFFWCQCDVFVQPFQSCHIGSIFFASLKLVSPKWFISMIFLTYLETTTLLRSLVILWLFCLTLMGLLGALPNIIMGRGLTVPYYILATITISVWSCAIQKFHQRKNCIDMHMILVWVNTPTFLVSFSIQLSFKKPHNTCNMQWFLNVMVLCNPPLEPTPWKRLRRWRCTKLSIFESQKQKIPC